jgi:hypothetical protein
MAEYYDMKDKMRRAAQDEQAARFKATTGNDPYATEIIAGESRVAAPPRVAAPDAGPQGTVRGVPEGMTAEYYAPQPPAPAPAASPADELVARVRRAYDRARSAEAATKSTKQFYRTAGTALGAAVGGGLAGPPGAIAGAPLGMAAGGFAEDLASEDSESEYEAARAAKREAERALIDGFRAGTISQEDLDAAMKRYDLVWTNPLTRTGQK